jgi:hypothetical protein
MCVSYVEDCEAQHQDEHGLEMAQDLEIITLHTTGYTHTKYNISANNCSSPGRSKGMSFRALGSWRCSHPERKHTIPLMERGGEKIKYIQSTEGIKS